MEGQTVEANSRESRCHRERFRSDLHFEERPSRGLAYAVGGGSALDIAYLQTAAGAVPQLISNMDVIDGAIIVPPGGVLALLATTTPVGHSAVSNLAWLEPLL